MPVKLSCVATLLFCSALLLDAQQLRYAPPSGIAVPPQIAEKLQNGVSKLGAEIEDLRTALKSKQTLLSLLPDVEIFQKAVEWLLLYDEFYRSNEFATARILLRQGMERARSLRNGEAPWTTATGLVVRGYVSKIDGSIQPYGLVVPASFGQETNHPRRLDVWLHGRDDHLTELKFLSDREKSAGEFAPQDALVLHPYGRFCNAFKFAGEVDVFEAMEHVQRHYPIDAARRAIRGFSMGGAGCWHLAVHHPGIWAAANPGAGFAETAIYTDAFGKGVKPPWYEQTLWHLYDSVDYAGNLFNCPMVAYSGEIDKQKQAADMMAAAMKREGLELVHVIGPKTAHKYEPQAKLEVAKRVDALVARGRELVPREVRFTTWSLRYNQCDWVAIQRMEKHCERARVDARSEPDSLIVKTMNVAELMLSFVADTGIAPPPTENLNIDGQKLAASWFESDGFRRILLRKVAGKEGPPWTDAHGRSLQGLSKLPGLQGPIDDAFMDSFLFVRPSGPALQPAVRAWIESAMIRATNEWRAQFRGFVRIKNDVDLSKDDVASANLVLWGDPQSNKLLARIAKQLPVQWNAKIIRVGGKSYDSASHIPLLIYPNPLNPRRYIVLNSGFTFAHEGAASNAKQTPKLPDYAVLSIDMADDPAKALRRARDSAPYHNVIEAGFFDEFWQIASL